VLELKVLHSAGINMGSIILVDCCQFSQLTCFLSASKFILFQILGSLPFS